MRTNRSRVRRALLALGVCAVPMAVFAAGYAVTGTGVASAPTDPSAPDQVSATSGADSVAARHDFYAKLPDRIGIVDGKGNPIGWADKSALVPPSANAAFDAKTEQAWWDKLVPVHDDKGTLIGYYLNGYGFIDHALAESPTLDADALRSQRAPRPHPFPLVRPARLRAARSRPGDPPVVWPIRTRATPRGETSRAGVSVGRRAALPSGRSWS